MDLLSSLFGWWVSQRQHIEALQQTNKHHEEELFQGERHHQQDIKFKCFLHKRGIGQEREFHYESMSRGVEFARREGVRDVWSQRSTISQTIMIVDTLMFACVFSLYTQSSIPQETLDWLVIVYAGSLAFSTSGLFVSMWFTMLLHNRMAKYDFHKPFTMYVCGKAHGNFNAYYDCHCRSIATLAMRNFQFGTTLGLVSSGIHLCCKLYYKYENEIATSLFAVFGGLFLLFFPIAEGVWPRKTSARRIDFGGIEMDTLDLQETLRRKDNRDEVHGTHKNEEKKRNSDAHNDEEHDDDFGDDYDAGDDDDAVVQEAEEYTIQRPPSMFSSLSRQPTQEDLDDIIFDEETATAPPTQEGLYPREDFNNDNSGGNNNNNDDDEDSFRSPVSTRSVNTNDGGHTYITLPPDD
eukprot:PhF_6_TR21200/c0_g1_i2/m.30600